MVEISDNGLLLTALIHDRGLEFMGVMVNLGRRLGEFGKKGT